MLTENEISKIVVESGITVHRALGLGLLESTYKACLAYELRKQRLRVETQVPLPVVYQDVKLEVGYRVDILVEKKVILELKSIETVLPVHEAQLISYLKLSGCKLGFLLNFNVYGMKDGIKRMVNKL